MNWITGIQRAIDYVEEHLTEPIDYAKVAEQAYSSSFHFQRVFSTICGFSLGDYIRFRRLSLAGRELAERQSKVIDVALKYRYDTPESFSRAFTRFHGVSPTAAKNGAVLKSFLRLSVKLTLDGGTTMDYRIEKKEEFTVIANAKKFPYEGAKEAIPQFWNEHYASGKAQTVCGEFGINIDEAMGMDTFEYLIADTYRGQDIPDGFVLRTIPSFNWAVFPCRGAMPTALQDVNTKIFTEWLPAINEYEFAAGYCVEMYDDPQKYAKGTMDENYYCEIWIPVKRK